MKQILAVLFFLSGIAAAAYGSHSAGRLQSHAAFRAADPPRQLVLDDAPHTEFVVDLATTSPWTLTSRPAVDSNPAPAIVEQIGLNQTLFLAGVLVEEAPGTTGSAAGPAREHPIVYPVPVSSPQSKPVVY